MACPKCHLPAKNIVYPWLFNASASVISSRGISCKNSAGLYLSLLPLLFLFLGEKFVTPTRVGYLPVSKLQRVGEQTGLAAQPLVKFIPSLARASMFGVSQKQSGLFTPMSIYPKSPTRRTTTFGLFSAPIRHKEEQSKARIDSLDFFLPSILCVY